MVLVVYIIIDIMHRTGRSEPKMRSRDDEKDILVVLRFTLSEPEQCVCARAFLLVRHTPKQDIFHIDWCGVSRHISCLAGTVIEAVASSNAGQSSAAHTQCRP